MTTTPVLTAAGRRLRHPVTKAVLPNVEDENAEPVHVNLADPHWYKALRCGDIEIADPEKTPDWYRDLHPQPAPEADAKADAEAPAAAPKAATPAKAPTLPVAPATPAADPAPTPKA